MALKTTLWSYDRQRDHETCARESIRTSVTQQGSMYMHAKADEAVSTALKPPEELGRMIDAVPNMTNPQPSFSA